MPCGPYDLFYTSNKDMKLGKMYQIPAVFMRKILAGEIWHPARVNAVDISQQFSRHFQQYIPAYPSQETHSQARCLQSLSRTSTCIISSSLLIYYACSPCHSIAMCSYPECSTANYC